MTRINELKTSDRNLAGPALWEIRRTDPVAYRAAIVARITRRCRDEFGAQMLGCGRCFTYPHFDGAVTVTAHVAECTEHGHQAPTGREQ